MTIQAPLIAKDAQRGRVAENEYTLVLGAGISIGVVPSWLDLTRQIINEVFGTSYDQKKFKQVVFDQGWGLDSWIQTAANAFVAKGNEISKFDDVIEEILYGEIRSKAREHDVDTALLKALNDVRRGVSYDEIDSLYKFFNEAYGDTSLVKLAKALSKSYKNRKLPAAIITFNADTLLHTVLEIFIMHESQVVGVTRQFPKRIFNRVLRGLHLAKDAVPIYHCHGALVPVPVGQEHRHDSRDKLIFKENDYLQASMNFTSWAQNVFLFHAQSTRMLIVGYSMGDTDVRQWLYWSHLNSSEEMVAKAGNENMSARHYWLTTRQGDTNLRAIQERSMDHLGVRLCWIDNWGEISDALTNLLGV